MKLILSFVVLLGLGAGGYFYFTRQPNNQVDNSAAGRPTTALVEPRDISFAVSAAGDIGPADQVSVRPEVNGRIVELPVDIGDEVKKGQLLCRLDDKELATERASRLAQIDGAKLQLLKAQRGYDRSRQLFAENLVSREAFDDAKTDFDLATNALDRALTDLSQVEERLSKTKIVAPFDCTVLTRPVSLGQTVSGAAGFNSGTEVMSIANLKNMIVNAHVNQADVIRLQQGRDVEIQAESVPGVKMRGTVERIAPQAVIKNGIKGFACRIAIKDIASRVRPGMTAILSIPVSSADNVLAIPLAAVFSENGERFAFVRTDDGFERRPILLGVTDYAFAEVIQGLAAGDVVSLEQTLNPNKGDGGKPGATTAAGAKGAPTRAEVKGPNGGTVPAPVGNIAPSNAIPPAAQRPAKS
jgi:RND family efflux transporter MFP subunit